MVNITSLTGKGLKDWLIQRVSAVYFLIYCIVLAVFFMVHAPMNYLQFSTFFSNSWVKMASLIALLALSLHAYIGIWTVITDYIRCMYIRVGALLLVILGLLGQFIWGVMILWGHM